MDEDAHTQPGVWMAALAVPDKEEIMEEGEPHCEIRSWHRDQD